MVFIEFFNLPDGGRTKKKIFFISRFARLRVMIARNPRSLRVENFDAGNVRSRTYRRDNLAFGVRATRHVDSRLR